MRFRKLTCLVVLLLVTLNNAIPMSEFANGEDLKLDSLAHAQCLAKCNYQSGYDHLIGCNNECIRRSKSPNAGVCPEVSLEDFNKFFRPLPECEYDVDCGNSQKCCTPSSVEVCMDPFFHDPSKFPPKPYEVELVDDSGGQAYVQWKVEKFPMEDVMFVMESRNHYGVNFTESKMSEYRTQPFLMQVWKTSSYEDHYLVSRKVQLKARRTYQFRVASVNQYGTHGFAVSGPSQLIRDPFPPKQVKNVTMGRWFTYDEETFCRQISWIIVKSDLKIHRVKLIWYPVGDDNSTDQWTVSVKPQRFNYEIRDLQPNTEYEVEVIAVSHYDNIRYLSSPVYVTFFTPENFDSITVKSPKQYKNQPKPKPRYPVHNEYNVTY